MSVTHTHLFTGRFGPDPAANPFFTETFDEDGDAAWPLEDDLGLDLDPDFVEVIGGPDRARYLRETLDLPDATAAAVGAAGHDTLVLISFEPADEPADPPGGSARLSYHGRFTRR